MYSGVVQGCGRGKKERRDKEDNEWGDSVLDRDTQGDHPSCHTIQRTWVRDKECEHRKTGEHRNTHPVRRGHQGEEGSV